MLGAIIGDIVGSRFEFVEEDNRGKDFAFSSKSFSNSSVLKPRDCISPSSLKESNATVFPSFTL